MENGENHRVPCAQQLQTKSNEVDPAGRVRKTNSVRPAPEEIGLTCSATKKKAAPLDWSAAVGLVLRLRGPPSDATICPGAFNFASNRRRVGDLSEVNPPRAEWLGLPCKQPSSFGNGDPSYIVVASTPGNVSPTALTTSNPAVGCRFFGLRHRRLVSTLARRS